MDEVKKSSAQIKGLEKENAIIKEMMPYFIYALIPITITLIIAYTCAPKMTLP